jgi:hypothetical protein
MKSHEEFEKVKQSIVSALPSEIEGPWQMSVIMGIIMAAYGVDSPQEASLVCVQAASDYCEFLVKQDEECTCPDGELH